MFNSTKSCSLGFGCAPILGRVGRRQSWSALEKAYDCGIRHFDIARSYGWGEAEYLLGEFLAQYPRQSYTLVSKCGLVPTPRSPVKSMAKAIGRTLVNLAPASRKWVVKGAASSFQPVQTYDLTTLESSLEETLKALRTDYLDILLLHNYAPDQAGLDAVIEWFQTVQKQGKIRRYGFCVEGTNLESSLAHLSRFVLLEQSIVQIPISAQLFNLDSSFSKTCFIFHSPFRFLKSLHLDDASDSVSLFPILLKTLSQQFRCEAVLSSMFNPTHIETNLQAALQSSQVSTLEVQKFLQHFNPTFTSIESNEEIS